MGTGEEALLGSTIPHTGFWLAIGKQTIKYTGSFGEFRFKDVETGKGWYSSQKLARGKGG